MTILVTGGAGFIGLNVLRRLLFVPDCEVRIYDDFSNSSPERVEQVVKDSPDAAARVQVVRGDIVDADAVRKAMHGVDTVIHLAAQTGVGPSIANPIRDLEINVAGTFNVLKACADAKARRFVLASSSATIGNARPPQREDMPTRPLSPYGASKAAGEAYCSAFHRSYGIETLALRFSNVYGPLSWSKGSVVAHFAKQAMAGKPLVINGDGSQTRDFLHVEDLADIICLAAQAPLPATLLGEPCNVATGVQTRIAELAQTFRNLLNARGLDCQLAYGPPLTGDVAVSAPAVERVKAAFPSATFRSLADGLPGTIDWFLSHWAAGAPAAATKAAG